MCLGKVRFAVMGRSIKIANMGVLCACMVVAIHIPWGGDERIVMWWFEEVMVKGFAKIAVPFFFLVSGFFLAAHRGEQGWYGSALRKRVTTLLVPYLAWEGIDIVITIVFRSVAAIHSGGSVAASIRALPSLGLMLGFDLCAYPSLHPLWYVRCLMLFVVASWIISWCIDHIGWMWLGVTWLFWLGYLVLYADDLESSVSKFFLIGFSASGLFFFSLGFYLGCLRMTKSGLVIYWLRKLDEWKWGVLFFGMVVLLLKATLQRWNVGLGNCLSVLPWLVMGVYSVVPQIKYPRWMYCAFPIFVMHMIWFRFLRSVLCHMDIGTVCSAGIQFISAVIVSAGVGALCHRNKFVASLLFGGR